MSNEAQKILAYLFSEAGSVAISDLAKYFNYDVSVVNQLLDEIIVWQTNTPFNLIRTDIDVAFVLNSEMSQIIAEMDKRETERELTKASLETLSVILYKGGATRAELDYIRGVNSSFSLRSLQARGYVERGPKNTYVPTADILAFLGISNLNELPNHTDIINQLNQISNQNDGTN